VGRANLATVWAGWRQALVIVSPNTVLQWQRRRFREHWTGLSGRPRLGRPPISAETAALIRRMAVTNPLWGAPRIHGELLKLGIDLAERTVSRLLAKRRPPPSQTWRTFLTKRSKYRRTKEYRPANTGPCLARISGRTATEDVANFVVASGPPQLVSGLLLIPARNFVAKSPLTDSRPCAAVPYLHPYRRWLTSICPDIEACVAFNPGRRWLPSQACHP
jgi:hypothetical protein